MRIKTNNKIIEVSNVEYDAYKHIISSDRIVVKIDNHVTFYRLLDQLLKDGYADFSNYL